MVNITIKNLPVVLHSRLKKQAKDHRRSLNKEIICQLEEQLAIANASAAEIIVGARKIRKNIKGFITENEIQEFKREGRK